MTDGEQAHPEPDQVKSGPKLGWGKMHRARKSKK